MPIKANPATRIAWINFRDPPTPILLLSEEWTLAALGLVGLRFLMTTEVSPGRVGDTTRDCTKQAIAALLGENGKKNAGTSSPSGHQDPISQTIVW